jgi:hypothetical protein
LQVIGSKLVLYTNIEILNNSANKYS